MPQGSHLLVESLDRLSRDRVLFAQALFLRIIEAGITIVTLIDDRSYSAESLNRSPMNLVVSLVCMMRANEESATKSARVRAAWARKRAELGTKPATGRCPGWLRLDKTTGRFVEREREADVVRRIYAEAAAGLGQYAIARKLNAEAVPLFSSGNQRGKPWGPKYIRSLLTAPAVRGTYIPCITGRDERGRLLLQPQAPVEGYYPAVVDAATCVAVAHAQELRRRAFRAPALRPINRRRWAGRDGLLRWRTSSRAWAAAPCAAARCSCSAAKRGEPTGATSRAAAATSVPAANAVMSAIPALRPSSRRALRRSSASVWRSSSNRPQGNNASSR